MHQQDTAPLHSFVSPAKLNLTLKVVGKLPSGYHSLISRFQAIDLCDTLTFQAAAQDSFTVSDPRIPTDDSNLVLQALSLFRRRTCSTQRYAIHLEKQIPSEAGLGGGSSNAATTLWALNSLEGSNITLEDLSRWGKQLGADVPFFFSRGSALCTGIGDVEAEFNECPDTHYQLIKPPVGLSTAAVFGAWRPSATTAANDLLAPALQLSPQLRQLYEELSARGYPVRLTGSGSCLFAASERPLPPMAGCWAASARPILRQQSHWYLYQRQPVLVTQ